MSAGASAPLRSYKVDGPAGTLEMLYRSPGGAPRGAVLICHPHPQFGGTLHSRVVFHLARAFHQVGYATLRFNFRGVGLSAGRYDGGVGELEDARAALEHLAGRHPGQPLVVAGHSFGAWVGLRLGAADGRVQRMVGVGVPLMLYPFDFLEGTGKGVLLVQGELDRLGTPDQVQDLAARLGGGARVSVVPRADHFLAGGEDRLREEIVAVFT